MSNRGLSVNRFFSLSLNNFDIHHLKSIYVISFFQGLHYYIPSEIKEVSENLDLLRTGRVYRVLH